MNALTYCKNLFQNEQVQKHLEEKVSLLLEGFLKEKSDYAKEKAVKSFSEGLKYLENNLLYQREIHPSTFDVTKWAGNEEEYINKYKEVEKILINEINRQYRHFIAFLSES